MALWELGLNAKLGHTEPGFNDVLGPCQNFRHGITYPQKPDAGFLKNSLLKLQRLHRPKEKLLQKPTKLKANEANSNMSWKENKIGEYFISSKAELKKVSWPTRPEIVRYSLLVIGVSLAIALFFGVIDYLLTLGLDALIR
jgi:preprotein translocase subunit SecE